MRNRLLTFQLETTAADDTVFELWPHSNPQRHLEQGFLFWPDQAPNQHKMADGRAEGQTTVQARSRRS
jgi:hypothetical protein